MGIVDEDVARVRDTTDIVSLIGEQVALRRVGSRYTGLCPFHQEKTPSFSVNPELSLYYCFGCRASGDAITFLRETEHLDFVEAIERLAQRAGITLRYDDRAQAKDRSRRTRLVEAVGAAVDYYHRLLLEAPEGGSARRYLRGRGFDGDAARRFQLGWAPDEWDALSRWLQQERRFARADLVEAGLAFVNKANRLQDQFRARLLFPIFDARGEPVGFGGRSLTDDGPKYKNSPESPIYHKSRLLYGLNWAKGDVVAKGEVVICEGYTDVMAFALAGAPNAVATCGTALADDHVRTLKNLARRVTLAYDADAAGQGAAEQWYRWEHTYELQVRVADLPPGRDPGDLWRDDRPRLTAALEGAKPFLQFRLDRALEQADLSTIEGRGHAAEIAAAIVAEHPGDLVRDQYAMQVSERLGLDADSVRAEVERARARPKGAAPSRADGSSGARASAPPSEPEARREADLLCWVIHAPELVTEWIDEALFFDPLTREAFDLLESSEDFHDALDAASPAVRDLLERLAVEEPRVDDELPVVRARLIANTVQPVAQRLADRMSRADDVRAAQLSRDLDVLKDAVGTANWPRAQAAAEALVGWVKREGSAAGGPIESPNESQIASPTESQIASPTESVEQQA